MKTHIRPYVEEEGEKQAEAIVQHFRDENPDSDQ